MCAFQILHIENGKLTQSEYMAESIDLSIEEDASSEDDIERRASIDLDELQMAHERKSVDSLMLEVKLTTYLNLNDIIINENWPGIQRIWAFVKERFRLLLAGCDNTFWLISYEFGGFDASDTQLV